MTLRYELVRLRGDRPIESCTATTWTAALQATEGMGPLRAGETLHVYASRVPVTLGEVAQAIREHRDADALALLAEYAEQRSR